MMSTLRPDITSIRCAVGNAVVPLLLAQPKRDSVRPFSITISRFGLREGPGGTEDLQATCVHPPSLREFNLVSCH